MNSKPITQTWYNLRFALWIFRLVWNRRVAWMLVCVVSLLMLYYQWENRRSARELQIARVNGFSNASARKTGSISRRPSCRMSRTFSRCPSSSNGCTAKNGSFATSSRKTPFLPPNFVSPAILENEADGTSRVDFVSWAQNRDLKGESPEIAMNRELGDANGLLPKLAAGLSRPLSAMKPHQREELTTAGANPYDVRQPNISYVNQHMQDLGLHLRVAAAAGDVEKTRNTALILLRLFPETSGSHHSLVGSLVSIAAHGIAFEALQDALGKPAWDENSLRALQLQLGKINDLELMQNAMSMETLTGYGVGLFIRESCRKQGNAVENAPIRPT